MVQQRVAGLTFQTAFHLLSFAFELNACDFSPYSPIRDVICSGTLGGDKVGCVNKFDCLDQFHEIFHLGGELPVFGSAFFKRNESRQYM